MPYRQEGMEWDHNITVVESCLSGCEASSEDKSASITIDKGLQGSNDSSPLNESPTNVKAPGIDNKSIAKNTCQSSSCGAQNSDIKAHSMCIDLGEKEYRQIVNSIPNVRRFQTRWGTSASYLNRICGYNQAGSRYHCVEFSLACRCEIDSHDNATFCPAIIPLGMPYSLVTSNVYGNVIMTPFYSYIPSLQRKVPDILFLLHKLTLSKVINNAFFRHELAFNPRLRVEPPVSMLEALSCSELWMGLREEAAIILYDPLVRAPVPMLFELLNGMRSLMLSVFPAKLRYDILTMTETRPLTDYSNGSAASDFLQSFVLKLTELLRRCIFPKRVHSLKILREHFNNAHESPYELVQGIRIALALLNWTKLDQINSRIKERLIMLQENTERVERIYYQSQIQMKRINRHDFLAWIRKQPDMLLLPQQNMGSLNSTHIDKVRWLLSRLVAGFLWRNLRHESLQDTSYIFPLDSTRIESLRKRFSNTVLETLDGHLYQMSRESDYIKLQARGNIQESQVYKLIELRLLIAVAKAVYEELLSVICGVDGNIKRVSKRKTHIGSLDSIVKEISLLLILHWSATWDLYEVLS